MRARGLLHTQVVNVDKGIQPLAPHKYLNIGAWPGPDDTSQTSPQGNLV